MHFSNRNLSKMPENNLNLLFSILHLTPPRTILFCQSGIFIASILHHERNPFNKQHLSSFSKCILHINTSMITATLINSAPLYYLLIKCKLFSDLHAILLFFFLISLSYLILKNILCFPVKSQFNKVIENCQVPNYWKLSTPSCRDEQKVDLWISQFLQQS